MSAPTGGSTLSRTAWLVVALLMPVALLNYLDRQLLAAMKYSVMGSLPSIGTEENWGIMLGQFKWVYAVLSPIGGYIADRFSRRFTICASLFVWSAVTWSTGHVHTYGELLVARSLMGISEAFYIPAALALIADYHAGATRSRAVGLHQMAIYAGVITGGFGGYVADAPALGWRFAFDACGVVGMLYALPLVFVLRDAPRSPAITVAAKVSPVRAAGYLVANFSFLLLVLYFTLPALAGWVVRDWGPTIIKQQHGVSQGQAGVVATVYWQCAAIAGAIAGGWLADHWMRRSDRGRIFTSAIGMSLIVPAIFGIGNAVALAVGVQFLVLYGLGWGFGDCVSLTIPATIPSVFGAGNLVALAAAALFLILFGLGWGLFDCNNMPILCQIVRPELRATGYGVMNLVSISCGGLADWGFGALRDRRVPDSVIFSMFAGAAIFSVVLVLLIRPRKDLLARERVAAGGGKA